MGLALGILLGVVLTLVAAYAGAQYAAVKLSIRPPRVHQFVSPGALGLPQETFQAKTEDGVLIDGWLVDVPGETVIVACHGYLVNRCEWVPSGVFLAGAGCACVFFDHRGHGRSGAAQVTLGRDEKMDVIAVLEKIKTRFPDRKIVLLGSSMGAVASVLAAAERPELVDGMILDAPFRSMKEASEAWWLFLGGEAADKWMRPTRLIGPRVMGFDPGTVRVDEAMARTGGKPVLLSFGTKDPIVPVASAQAIADANSGPTKVIWFEGATHGAGRMYEADRFRQEILSFLTENGFASGKETRMAEQEPAVLDS